MSSLSCIFALSRLGGVPAFRGLQTVLKATLFVAATEIPLFPNSMQSIFGAPTLVWLGDGLVDGGSSRFHIISYRVSSMGSGIWSQRHITTSCDYMQLQPHISICIVRSLHTSYDNFLFSRHKWHWHSGSTKWAKLSSTSPRKLSLASMAKPARSSQASFIHHTKLREINLYITKRLWVRSNNLRSSEDREINARYMNVWGLR